MSPGLRIATVLIPMMLDSWPGCEVLVAGLYESPPDTATVRRGRGLLDLGFPDTDPV